ESHRAGVDVDDRRVGHTVVRRERSRGVGLVEGIDTDEEHLARLEFLVRLLQQGGLRAAWRAPGVPEVHDDHLAEMTRAGDVLAGVAWAGEIDRRPTILCADRRDRTIG